MYEGSAMQFFNLTIGEKRFNCALFATKLSDDYDAMHDVARSAADASVNFGGAEFTPVQAAAAYAAARCAVAEFHTKQAVVIGGVSARLSAPLVEEVVRQQTDWLQSACHALGDPVSIEEAAKRLTWMRERISVC